MMMFIRIMLILPKLIFKLAGYAFSAILKAIGFTIMLLAALCGKVTNTLGSLIITGAVVYTVCGFCGVGNLNATEYWWVSGAVCGAVGFVVASLSVWVQAIGLKFFDIGDDVAYGLGKVHILSF